jgi:hypothetical protein
VQEVKRNQSLDFTVFDELAYVPPPALRLFKPFRCFGDLWIKSLSKSKAAVPLLADESGLVTDATMSITGKS